MMPPTSEVRAGLLPRLMDQAVALPLADTPPSPSSSSSSSRMVHKEMSDAAVALAVNLKNVSRKASAVVGPRARVLLGRRFMRTVVWPRDPSRSRPAPLLAEPPGFVAPRTFESVADPQFATEPAPPDLSTITFWRVGPGCAANPAFAALVEKIPAMPALRTVVFSEPHWTAVPRDLLKVAARAPIRELRFLDCPNLRDVSVLAQIASLQRVTFLKCPSLVDLAPLRSVANVFLRDCPRARDLRPLARAHTVCVVDDGPTDLAPLRDCFSIMASCKGLTTLEPLRGGSFREVHFLGENHISDWSPLAGARTVVVNDARALADLLPFADAEHVSLANCDAVQDVGPLANVRSLAFTACSRLVDLSPLVGAVRLTVSLCHAVRRLPPGGANSPLRELRCYYLDHALVWRLQEKYPNAEVRVTK